MTATMLREITDDALADLYRKVSHDEEAARLVIAEAKRRERLESGRKARDAEREEWEMMAWAQYEAAERECRGQLIRHANRDCHEFREATPPPRRLTPDSDDAAELKARRHLCGQCGHPLRHPWHEGVSAFILWENTEEWARKYGSEELCAFWDHSPRLSVTQYRDQIAAGRRIQRAEREAAELDANHDDTEVRETTMTEQTTDRATAFAARREQLAQECADRADQYRGQIAVRAPSAVAAGRRLPDAVSLLRRTLEGMGLLFTDYVAFPSRSAVIGVVTWTAQAAARDSDGELIWRAYPRLLATSRRNGSGKSTLGDLVSMLLQCRAGRMSKVTPYGLTKVLGTLKETAIADDAQNVFRSDKAGAELLTIMINGYTRGATWVSGKADGKIEPASGPLMVIGKDDLITTRGEALKDLIDRSVVVRMERPDRYMPEVDETAEARAKSLAATLKAVMGALQVPLRHAARELAEENRGRLITDGDGGRTAQIWRPMLAVARVAGDQWYEATLQAMEELSAAGGDLLEAEDALAALEDVRDDGRSFWDAVPGSDRTSAEDYGYEEE